MNLNELYEPIPEIINQVVRKHNERNWSATSDELILKGVAVSSEFKDVLTDLSEERNLSPTIIIRDSLHGLIDRNRPVWVESKMYKGDEFIGFKISKNLQDRIRQYDESLSNMVKQGIIEFFEQSGTDFDKLVKEKGGDGL